MSVNYNVLGLIFASMHDSYVSELTKQRTMGSIPFGGRYRLIDFPLSNMVNSSVSEVGVITKSNYGSLLDHLGSGRDWDLSRKKGGLHLLIGFDESGSICGISVISIGETPGLGTKVQNKDFLDKFKGISSEDYQVDNITGATYSSKGMKAAVNTALEAYSQMKGESENG